MNSRSAARLRATTRSIGIALVATGATLSLCGTASAQFAFEDEILPPRVVAWRLADRGFSGVGRPRFDGRVYVVDATGPTGVPVRLLVDPVAGAIIGRQRLGAPETYARLEHPAPGFGWTEDEAAAPRRVVRPAPVEDTPVLRLPRRPAGEVARPEANPDGLNPDAAGRTGAPRKVARATPAKPPELRPALRTSPEAPAPKVAPAEPGRADAKVDTKPDTRDASVGTAQPAAPPSAKPADKVVAEAPKATKDWKDPPSDKKPVRVIGGATIVPGTAEKEPGAAQ